ncbi:hypothetical protein [Actinoplanes friuliensis]|uniref:Uncharacterized protein n=1 Tax=Actinoplanes friuliensis DSM 7358 TaxID=1246995 RepID=U5W2H5_9ACTN|nr:hypothetical protein [Actinoplanes friuliensis]AGZ42106.1 hypothetical protein AFR_19170 [Actinoplanes friuliensis DSM 7358]
MEVLLAGGIRPKPDHRVHAVARTALLPGTPVAVGPADEGPANALARLHALVAAGGVIAAGAGVDLGDGFRSARIDGGVGDRRDAVLAALSVPAFADHLGAPTALLVALFGPFATRPLGTVTLETIAAGRWPILRYAVACSDLLGPEQLVQLLALRAPEGVDPFPAGLPSVVATQLRRVTAGFSAPRRLRVLTDLWEQACGSSADRARRERIRGSQGRHDRYEELFERRRRHESDLITAALHRHFCAEPSLADVALWSPPAQVWVARADRIRDDAFAATVLARVAATAAEAGPEEALRRHQHEIAAGAATLSKRAASAASRAVPGLTGHPARPAVYLRDIHERIPVGVPLSPKRVVFLRDRFALARDYGQVALAACNLFLTGNPESSADGRDARSIWLRTGLRPWREQVGYFSPDRLPGWDLEPEDGAEPLGRRPADTETVADLLWYAELADAVARLNGHAAARLERERHQLFPDTNPAPEQEEPATVADFAAGAAQLAELGGAVPPRARTWTEVVAGLHQVVEAATAQSGRFVVPPAVDAFEGQLLPGSGMRMEIARTALQLVGWAGYMGNCIAEEPYPEDAAKGRVMLVALRGPDGRIRANVEVRLTGRGWRLAQIQGRFNDDPDPELRRSTEEWVASLPRTVVPPPADSVPEPAPARRPARPSPARRIVADLGDQLGDLAAGTVGPAPVLAALIDAPDGPEALVALRRSSPATLLRAVRRALAGPVTLDELWAASARRPLAEAVAALSDEEVRDRLAPLTVDAPLPGALRKLARLPRIAPARTADQVAIRVRAALGTLIRIDAPELSAAMTSRPHAELLRAGALAVTSWGGLDGNRPVIAVMARRRIRVPGYPQTTLRDDLWQQAWPGAEELGAARDVFWDAIAAKGLLVPASWLEPAGWPALWARAHRR